MYVTKLYMYMYMYMCYYTCVSVQERVCCDLVVCDYDRDLYHRKCADWTGTIFEDSYYVQIKHIPVPVTSIPRLTKNLPNSIFCGV